MNFKILYIKVKDGVRFRHPKCEGYSNDIGEFYCGYDTTLDCEECKYGVGRKDPEAKCNKIKRKKL